MINGRAKTEIGSAADLSCGTRESCFGEDGWPERIPEPTATIEFELADAAAVDAAVQETKESGQEFVHEARTEPWGQTVSRFMPPEGVLVGLSYAPWLRD